MAGELASTHWRYNCCRWGARNSCVYGSKCCCSRGCRNAHENLQILPQINHCMEEEDMPGNCGLVGELAVFATLPVAEMLFLDSLPNVSQRCTLTARKDNRFLGGMRKNRRSKDSSIDRRIPSYLAVLRLYLDYCKLSIHQERYQKIRMSWAQGHCSGWGLEHLRDWGMFSLEKRQLVGGNLAAASQYLQARLSIR